MGYGSWLGGLVKSASTHPIETSQAYSQLYGQAQDPNQVQAPLTSSSFGPTSMASPITAGRDSMRDALKSIMRDETPIGGRIGDLWKMISDIYNPGARQ